MAGRSKVMTVAQLVELFAKQWEKEQGYKPAGFQKAIAKQRIARGESIREIMTRWSRRGFEQGS